MITFLTQLARRAAQAKQKSTLVIVAEEAA